MPSRRTESRNLTGNGKVGGNRASPRRHGAQSATTHGYKRNGSDANGQERDAEARTACGNESLSSLRKAASHHQRSYGEEGADDRRPASTGEKEGFISFALVKLFHLNNNTGMLRRR
jgi:hypothetical protein